MNFAPAACALPISMKGIRPRTWTSSRPPSSVTETALIRMREQLTSFVSWLKKREMRLALHSTCCQKCCPSSSRRYSMTTTPQWQISNGTGRGFLNRIAGRYCWYRNQIKHSAGAPKSSRSTELRRRRRVHPWAAVHPERAPVDSGANANVDLR
jgi:hypothetical protein